MDPAEIDRIGAYNVHPVDILEPEEESQIHKDRIRSMQCFAHAMEWMRSAKFSEVGWWQVIYAFGYPQGSRPMAEVAAELGVERATISAGARSLLRALDMPPSQAMRSEDAVKAYKRCRVKQLKKPTNKKRNGNDRKRVSSKRARKRTSH